MTDAKQLSCVCTKKPVHYVCKQEMQGPMMTSRGTLTHYCDCMGKGKRAWASCRAPCCDECYCPKCGNLLDLMKSKWGEGNCHPPHRECGLGGKWKPCAGSASSSSSSSSSSSAAASRPAAPKPAAPLAKTAARTASRQSVKTAKRDLSPKRDQQSSRDRPTSNWATARTFVSEEEAWEAATE